MLKGIIQIFEYRFVVQDYVQGWNKMIYINSMNDLFKHNDGWLLNQKIVFLKFMIKLLYDVKNFRNKLLRWLWQKSVIVAL